MDKHKLVECGIMVECVGCSQQVSQSNLKCASVTWENNVLHLFIYCLFIQAQTD